ncbi:DNA gyrase modulator, partial [Mesorhizobium sp.]
MTNTLDAGKLTGRVAALVEAAKRAGADAADAVAVRGRSAGVSVRLGKVEGTESSESEDVSLRVFV